MSMTTRLTRDCAFSELKPELLAAIHQHIEKYQLGDIEATQPVCFETTSTGKKTGLFSYGEEITVTGMLLTSQFLLWTKGKKSGKPVVMSALLRNINVQDFEDTAMYRVKPDSGMNITGRYTDVTKQGQSFIAVGMDPAGEKFRHMLQHAVQKGQNPER